MIVWIEDRNGNRLGTGPIDAATGWTQTARLDAAGEFSFSIPADHPKARLVRPKRWARAWHWESAGGWRQVGYGRIETVTTDIGDDGRAVLTARGVDELGELADRICHRLSLVDEVQVHPSEVYDWDGASTYQMYQGTYDYAVGDTSTADTLVYSSDGHYLLIRAHRTFHKVSVVVAPPAHSNASRLTAYYWNGTEWTTLQITDGTSVTNAYGQKVTLAQSGDITFTPPSDWAIQPGKVLYELRLKLNGAVTSAKISDISIWWYTPNSDPLHRIMAYAPPGWGLDDVNGYTTLARRPLGTEMITNGSFSSYSGTLDDGVTDTFTGWTNNGTGTGRLIEAVTRSSGNVAVKITSNSGANYVYLSRNVSVTAGQMYRLSFATRSADGVGQIRCIVSDQTSGGSGQELLVVDSMVLGTSWQTCSYMLYVPVGVTTIGLRFDLHYNTSSSAAAFLDDVSLRAGGEEAIYLQVRDQSVLEALRRTAQLSNEHFILSPAGRKVLWLGQDVRDSGLRALAGDIQLTSTSVNTLLLTDLQEVEDAAPLVTRVYPYGGGMGASRQTLLEATGPYPAGYTVDKTNNYIQRDAAATNLGVIEKIEHWQDIAPADASMVQRQHAANALLWQAWQYLEQHTAVDIEYGYSDVPKFYRATVVKAERMVLPGYTLRLQYWRVRDGIMTMYIDADLWVTGVTHRVTDAGVDLIGLELSTVPRQPMSEWTALARAMQYLRGLPSHATAESY